MLNFLLIQCDEKDREKVEILYKKFHNELVKKAKRKLRNGSGNRYEQDAEDVVQNVFMRLTQYIYRVDTNWPIERLTGYVQTTFNNAIADFYRTAEKYPQIVELNEDILAEMDEAEFLARVNVINRKNEVMEAICQLEPIYKSALVYRFVENMTVDEIAELMGIPAKTVYTRIERGKRILLAILEEDR